MSEVNADLRQVAIQYREKLQSELAKVEQFLKLADQISKSNDSLHAESSDSEAPLELHNRTLNAFRESG